MLKYRRFVAFYFLTFLLLGLLPLFSMVFNDGSMDFDDAAKTASHTTGIEWTSNVLVVLRLSLVEPVLLLTLLGSMAPALAAILMLIYIGRKNVWTLFFMRLLAYRNMTPAKALKIYGFILFSLIPCLFLVYIIRQFTGGNYETSAIAGVAIVPSILTIAFLDQGALLEELGWRGFATPELQEAGVPPLKVAIIVGLCWGFWHLPRDIATGVIERLGVFDYTVLFLPAFILGTVSVSVIASYFMNRLGGSVVPGIVVHGITNDAVGLSGSASIVEALTPYHQATKSIPLALLTLLLVLYAGQQLGLDKAQPATSDNDPAST